MTERRRPGAGILALFAATALSLPAFAAPWPGKSARLGAEEHPRIVAALGGALTGNPLAAYVDGIGHRLVQGTDRSDAKWTFTILDTPAVNAFALPGGYIYVTRGLLALANDEAELAGVLGHEIGHAVAGHGEQRMRRTNTAGVGVLLGTIVGGVLGGAEGAEDAIRLGSTIASGVLAQYSQKQEFQADNLGVRLIAAAGYDPVAAADFLDSLAANEQLQARIAGGNHNPNRVDFFASHPATGARVRKAVSEAKSTGAVGGGGDRGEAAYLAKIDGMIFGDVPSQGFVRQNQFLHPVLRFAVTAPDGFRLVNSPAQLAGTDGKGGQFLVEDGGAFSGSMQRYITDVWAPELARMIRLAGPIDARAVRIGGLEAAIADVAFQGQQGAWRARIVALRHGLRIYRLTGIAPASAPATLNRLNAAVQSFRPLSKAEAGRLKPTRITIVTIRKGDTAAALARRMNVPALAEDWFRALNGYGPGAALRAGDRVKLVQ